MAQDKDEPDIQEAARLGALTRSVQGVLKTGEIASLERCVKLRHLRATSLLTSVHFKRHFEARSKQARSIDLVQLQHKALQVGYAGKHFTAGLLHSAFNNKDSKKRVVELWEFWTSTKQIGSNWTWYALHDMLCQSLPFAMAATARNGTTCQLDPGHGHRHWRVWSLKGKMDNKW